MIKRFGVVVFCSLLTILSLRNMASEPDRSEALSPDKLHLIRESKQANGVILELLDATSGITKPLVRLPGENRWPVWSPDGLFVAFCAVFHDRYFITVTDMTGHSWMVQEIHGGLTRISWSPNAVWLVYSSEATPGNRDLFIASAGGTDIRNLTQTATVSEDEAEWSTSLNRVDYRYRESANAPTKSAWLNPFDLNTAQANMGPR